ncbi:putative secreted protein [Streptomyces davaonensis JCM 4913]|uniref:Putative secreted protein n=1 Tax=Streptomyces davaonensis (strain DSM 101723 / JCM 4913 / KCC S-0913 / 768) TaxID=1214101 RepID=K4QUC5_STRDJ|nr:hypothetical protein [Streptomyces davaonensis]CCK24553.1 putative secreted protein [Streptomyces davaonensis JCM 4913]
MPRTRRPSTPDTPYWTHRSWQASAAFLAVVALAAAVVFFTSGAERGGYARAVSRTPASSEVRVNPCRAQAPAQQSEGAPADLRWGTVHGTRVPVSASQGPARREGRLWRCFARTRVGAALAAQIICSQMSSPAWRLAVQDQVVPGRGRERFAAKREFVQDTAESAAPATATWAGYRTLSYQGRSATVGLLIKTAQGYTATSVRMRWADGDWKVLAGDDGALYSRLTASAVPSGYTLWEA